MSRTPCRRIRPAKGAFAGVAVVALSLLPLVAAPVGMVAGAEASDSRLVQSAKRPGVPAVVAVARAFRGAPPPRFTSLTVKTTVSDDSLVGETAYTLLRSDGLVTLVTEVTRATQRGGLGGARRSTVTGRSRYVLGGLILVSADWKEVHEDADGSKQTLRDSAETTGFSRISGSLFPLAVGKSLALTYRGRIKTAGRVVVKKMSYRVTRRFPAKQFDARLDGDIFVIRFRYEEEGAEEIFKGSEEIYYATALGWPVRTRRQEAQGGVVFETRLAAFTVKTGD